MENTYEKSNYGKRPLWQWVAIYGAFAVVIYGAVYLFWNNNAANIANQLQSNLPVPTAAPRTGEMQITVSGNEFTFNPSSITVQTGQPVRLTFKNDGQYPHNLTVPDLNVQTKTIQSGEEDTIIFTPNKTGTFTILCTVQNHEERGMTGTFIVE